MSRSYPFSFAPFCKRVQSLTQVLTATPTPPVKYPSASPETYRHSELLGQPQPNTEAAPGANRPLDPESGWRWKPQAGHSAQGAGFLSKGTYLRGLSWAPPPSGPPHVPRDPDAHREAVLSGVRPGPSPDGLTAHGSGSLTAVPAGGAAVRSGAGG